MVLFIEEVLLSARVNKHPNRCQSYDNERDKSLCRKWGKEESRANRKSPMSLQKRKDEVLLAPIAQDLI